MWAIVKYKETPISDHSVILSKPYKVENKKGLAYRRLWPFLLPLLQKAFDNRIETLKTSVVHNYGPCAPPTNLAESAIRGEEIPGKLNFGSGESTFWYLHFLNFKIS